jgi:acetyl esterase/lipase
MLLEQYPPQEPLSERGQPYSRDLWSRSAAVPYEEVAYGEDPYQRIAMVLPKRPSGKVFVFLHGGGWTGGYKEWNLFMAPAFTEAGAIFATAGYRLAPRHLFPDNRDDVARSLAWIHRNIAKYGGDPTQVYIGGHSAGGHLSSLLAVSTKWRAEHGVPRNFIRACLPVSGVFRFGEGSGLSMRPRFLGPASEDIDREASPILQMEKPLPPFFVAYGEKDFPHLIAQANEMIAALRAQGAQVEQMVLSGKTHLEAHVTAGDARGDWARTALRFIGEN